MLATYDIIIGFVQRIVTGLSCAIQILLLTYLLAYICKQYKQSETSGTGKDAGDTRSAMCDGDTAMSVQGGGCPNAEAGRPCTCDVWPSRSRASVARAGRSIVLCSVGLI